MLSFCYRNGITKTITAWFVGKILFFFPFNFEDDPMQQGSLYALVETAKSHQVAKHDPSIPTVTLFEANDSPKLAVVDVANIVSMLALIPVVHRHGSAIVQTKEYYCIAPSTCFNIDRDKSVGKLKNLY